MINKFRSFLMAMPVVALAATPAMADLSGNYFIQAETGKGLPSYKHACITLQQTGQVLGFVNSGTATIHNYTGTYYVLHSQIVLSVPGAALLTGILHGGQLLEGLVTVFNDNNASVVGAHTFKITKGGC